MLTIVMPMAGEGRRFVEAGYATPKPFLDVAGKPMIQRAWEGLPSADEWVFVSRKEHEARLRWLLQQSAPEGTIHLRTLTGTTPGPACTVLEAESRVNPLSALLCADCDQVMDWDPEVFCADARSADGMLVTFAATAPCYAYARVDRGHVTAVWEKQPLSPHAIAGAYYWRTAGLASLAIRSMIHRDQHTNGEFYLAPAYNELIRAGLSVGAFPVSRVWSLGTPEALQRALVHGPWGGDDRMCGQIPPEVAERQPPPPTGPAAGSLDHWNRPPEHWWGQPPEDHRMVTGLVCTRCGAVSDEASGREKCSDQVAGGIG